MAVFRLMPTISLLLFLFISYIFLSSVSPFLPSLGLFQLGLLISDCTCFLDIQYCFYFNNCYYNVLEVRDCILLLMFVLYLLSFRPGLYFSCSGCSISFLKWNNEYWVTQIYIWYLWYFMLRTFFSFLEGLESIPLPSGVWFSFNICIRILCYV